ncbi:MAG: cation:proton antiporter [Planctomycetes bacterium]|nr:cation:proton antiporter [Planctomycetota bacterium]
MNFPLLRDIVVLLAVSIPAILAFRALRLPSLAGYLLVGIIAGPHALGLVRETEAVERLSEVGVVLLLFTLGLEFSPARFSAQKRAIVFGAGFQLALTTLVVFAIAKSFGVSTPVAILLGFLGTMSSTAFVLKAYQESRQLESPHGTLALGVLLMQDLAVIPMMLLLPALSSGDGADVTALGLGIVKGIAGIALVLLLARYAFPWAAHLVVKFGGRELFILFVVCVALGSAALTESFGLSLSLGAFVAGLFIAESDFSHQVIAEVVPFREVFNALFFLSVGMLLQPGFVAEQPWLVFSVGIAVVLVKFAVMAPIVLYLTQSKRLAVLVGIAVAQVGEFSFIVAHQAGEMLTHTEEQLFYAVTVLTMFATPFLLQAAPRILIRFGARGQLAERRGDEKRGAHDVLIIGFGHCGQQLAQVLTACGIRYTVLDLNADSVKRGRKLGIPIQFGDASSRETLIHAGLWSTKVVVFAMSDPQATRHSVALVRNLAPNVHVVVRTRFIREVDELLRLGADQVIPEEFETSIEIFSRVLQHLHVPRGNIVVQAELMRREGYHVLRTGTAPTRSLDAVRELLALTQVEIERVPDSSPAAGKTLAELELRARTGVSVIAAVRDGVASASPGPELRLAAGDVLVIVGSHAQIEACRTLLHGSPS